MKLLLCVCMLFTIAISVPVVRAEDNIVLPDVTYKVSENSRKPSIFESNALDLKKKLSSAKNSFKFKTPGTEDSEIDISGSILIIRDKTSSGSGFFTSLWGIPVAITEMQVIATMQNPVITDGKGNHYEVKTMLALPEKGVVIIELKNPGTLPSLPLAYNLAAFPEDSPVQAYGYDNSQGIITKLEGKIQKIDQQKIEISVHLTPSDSGGALVSANKVLGILAYPGKSTPDNENLQGTLLEGKSSYLAKYYGPPQCSAVRIASINPDNAETFNPSSSAGDIKMIRELREANNNALACKEKIIESMLKGKPSAKLIRSVWGLIHMNQGLKTVIEDCYSQLSTDPDKYSCSNKILEKQFLDELSIYRRNSRMWGFEDMFSSKDPAFMKNFLEVVGKLKRHFQVPPKCKFCRGKGYRMVEIDNPEYPRNKMAFAFKTVYMKCEQCNGTGKVAVSRYRYVLENEKYADKFFRPLKMSFLGFTPGSDKAASRPETSRMLFSQRITSDISSTYTYTKSPRFRLAYSVALNYVLGKLQEIKIYFPYSKELYQYMKARLEKKYGQCTWETADKSTFCEIDSPDYRITLGWTYKISAKFKMQNTLYISCKHKELSKAKEAFSLLRRTASKVEDFKLKPKKRSDTGF